MPFKPRDISLGEINALALVLSTLELDIKDLAAALGAEDAATSVAALLQKEPPFPMRWEDATFHPYEYEEGPAPWPARSTIDADNLTYVVCADCGTHVWVEACGLRLHLSKRSTKFVQVGPGLQVKPSGQGLYVMRPRFVEGSKFCRYACD